MTESRAAHADRPAIDGLELDPVWARRAFVLLAAAAFATAAYFRWSALSRAQAPFLADSIEYVLMGRSPVTGETLPVKPVRPGLFPLFLIVPYWLEQHVLPPGLLFGQSIALLVPLGFWALTVWGAYRLGFLLAGTWAGLLAAFYTTLLPQLTYWSSDILSDVPAAAACVWAVVFWMEQKSFRVGLALGCAVILRYQSLMTMGAFFLVPVALRRWRDLGRMLLGLVPPALALGAIDFWYWGSPFHSFLLYVPRQLTTFLPQGLVREFLPLESVQVMKPTRMNLEAVVAKPPNWYLQEAPKFFTWWLLIPLFAYPLAHWRARNRSGALVMLWVGGVTFAVLSLQRYKELRYLLPVAPMAAALAAAGAIWLMATAARWLPRRSLTVTLSVAIPLLVLGALFTRRTWQIQGHLPYRPFGSTREAIAAIPETGRPYSLCLKRPWILAVDHPFDAALGHSWFSPGLRILDLDLARPLFNAPRNRRRGFPFRRTLENIDYFVIVPRAMHVELGRWQWLNQHTVFEGYFYERIENLSPAILLRHSDEPDDPRPFWDFNDQVARTAPVQAHFETTGELPGIAVDWLGAEAWALPTARNVVKFEFRWRLPEENANFTLAAEFQVENARGTKLGDFRSWLVPDDPFERRDRKGAAYCERLYEIMPVAAGDELHLRVQVVALAGADGETVREQLETSAPGAELGPDGWILPFALTVREPPAPPPPPATAPEPTDG